MNKLNNDILSRQKLLQQLRTNILRYNKNMTQHMPLKERNMVELQIAKAELATAKMAARKAAFEVNAAKAAKAAKLKKMVNVPKKMVNVPKKPTVIVSKDSVASKIGKFIVIILIIAALVWLGMFLYKRLRKTPAKKQLLNYTVLANQPLLIKNNDIPKSRYGNEYTLSYWIYVNDWEFKNKLPKSVLYRGDKGAVATNPGFWFFPEDNNLKIVFQLQSFKPTSAQLQLLDACPNSMNPLDNPNFSKDHKGTCNIKNIPLQRWNNICVSVWNQSVDVYLNGKLVRSCVMHEYPVPSNGDIHIGHKEGFNGLVSSVQYHPSILTPEEIYKIYTTGPELKKKDVEIEGEVKDYAIVA